MPFTSRDVQGARKELVEVTWEDQQNINAFADLIRKHTMVKASMDDKKVQQLPPLMLN
jgi:hypothetical protein